MDARIPRFGDSAMLFAAIVLGAVLTPAFSLVGVPIAAAGVAGLAYRGRTAIAAGAAVVGIVVVGMRSVFDVAYAGPALAAVVLTVVLLRTKAAQPVAAVLVAVLAAASVAADAIYAGFHGTTLSASVASQTATVVAELTKTMGASASADTLRTLKDAAAVVSATWPSAYFQAAVATGVLAIFAVAWAARKVDNPLNIGTVSTLDLSPHILWAFVVGLLLLAVSYSSLGGVALFGMVGLNLVLCARTLFFLQGFSVVAGLLDRAGVGLGGRILALAALAALDAFTLVVSFTGLLDFWINFRRLPRDGVAPTTAEPEGRRW